MLHNKKNCLVNVWLSTCLDEALVLIFYNFRT
jgi:hypothetical protein